MIIINAKPTLPFTQTAAATVRALQARTAADVERYADELLSGDARPEREQGRKRNWERAENEGGKAENGGGDPNEDDRVLESGLAGKGKDDRVLESGLADNGEDGLAEDVDISEEEEEEAHHPAAIPLARVAKRLADEEDEDEEPDERYRGRGGFVVAATNRTFSFPFLSLTETTTSGRR